MTEPLQDVEQTETRSKIIRTDLTQYGEGRASTKAFLTHHVTSWVADG